MIAVIDKTSGLALFCTTDNCSNIHALDETKIAVQVPNVEFAELNAYDSVNEEWVILPPKPARGATFNLKTKSWEIPESSFEAEKRSCQESLKHYVNQLEYSGLTVNKATFDTDEKSQTRILAAHLLEQPIAWTLKDNTQVYMSADEVLDLQKALMNHLNKCNQYKQKKRELIEGAQNIEDLRSIAIDDFMI